VRISTHVLHSDWEAAPTWITTCACACQPVPITLFSLFRVGLFHPRSCVWSWGLGTLLVLGVVYCLGRKSCTQGTITEISSTNNDYMTSETFVAGVQPANTLYTDM
jgi:hypothetical protein